MDTADEADVADTADEAAAASAEAEAANVVLDRQRALSDSILWDLQKAYFDATGASAWTTGGVPHYVTTNPTIARAYARCVHGHLSDLWAGESASGHTAAPAPMIVELGAGSGQFAHNFLRSFTELHRASPFADRDFTYVMTDFTPANLALWRSHRSFQQFVDAGQVDFALFDAAAPGPIHLELHDETIQRGDDARPIVVIANYVLDSIPHDLITATADGLVEHLVTITSTQPEPDLAAEGTLDRLEFEWTMARPDPERSWPAPIAPIVEWYSEHLADVAVLLPSAPIECLEFFRTVSAGPMLALVGDRGHSRLTDLIEHQGAQLGLHGGCFSLPVNFHALGLWAESSGGERLRMPGPHSNLQIEGLLTGMGERIPERLRAVFAASIAESGPDDFYSVKTAVERGLDDIELAEAFAVLRWSAWDPVVFAQLLPRLVVLVEQASARELADLRHGLVRVWEAHYPLPGGTEVAFSIASLLYTMSYYVDALDFLRISVDEEGADGATSYNIAMSHFQLHQLDEALAAIDEAIALAPDFAEARSMRLAIAAELDADR